MISVEYREEVHEKILRKVRRHLWNRAQIEEGGNGGTVQHSGQGRMEVWITEETTGSEGRKHTSGGVFVAINSNSGAVVGAEEGTMGSIPGIERIIVQVWGERQRTIAYLLSLLLALGRMDAEE